MRLRTIWACFTTSSPATSARPLSGKSSVVRIRTAVVLPAPLGPRTPRTLPSSATRSSPSRAWILPYDLWSPSARIAGVFAIGHLLLRNLILMRANMDVRPVIEEPRRGGGGADASPCVSPDREAVAAQQRW